MESLPPPGGGGGGSLQGDAAGSRVFFPAGGEQKVSGKSSPSSPKADASPAARDAVQDVAEELGDAEEELEDAEEELHEQAGAVELASVLTSSSIMAAAFYTKRDMLRLFFCGNDDHSGGGGGGGGGSGGGAGNGSGVMISAIDLLDLAAIALGAVVVPVSAALTARTTVMKMRRRRQRRKAAPKQGTRERTLDGKSVQPPAAAGEQLTPPATGSPSKHQSSVSSRHIGGVAGTSASAQSFSAPVSRKGPMQPKLFRDDMDSTHGSTRIRADGSRRTSRSRSLISNSYNRKSSGGSDSDGGGHESGNTLRRRGRGKKRTVNKRSTSESRCNGSGSRDGGCSSNGRCAASLIALVDLAVAASAGQPVVSSGKNISKSPAEAGGKNAELEEKIELTRREAERKTHKGGSTETSTRVKIEEELIKFQRLAYRSNDTEQRTSAALELLRRIALEGSSRGRQQQQQQQQQQPTTVNHTQEHTGNLGIVARSTVSDGRARGVAEGTSNAVTVNDAVHSAACTRPAIGANPSIFLISTADTSSVPVNKVSVPVTSAAVVSAMSLDDGQCPQVKDIRLGELAGVTPQHPEAVELFDKKLPEAANSCIAKKRQLERAAAAWETVKAVRTANAARQQEDTALRVAAERQADDAQSAAARLEEEVSRQCSKFQDTILDAKSRLAAAEEKVAAILGGEEKEAFLSRLDKKCAEVNRPGVLARRVSDARAGIMAVFNARSRWEKEIDRKEKEIDKKRKQKVNADGARAADSSGGDTGRSSHNGNEAKKSDGFEQTGAEGNSRVKGRERQLKIAKQQFDESMRQRVLLEEQQRIQAEQRRLAEDVQRRAEEEKKKADKIAKLADRKRRDKARIEAAKAEVARADAARADAARADAARAEVAKAEVAKAEVAKADAAKADAARAEDARAEARKMNTAVGVIVAATADGVHSEHREAGPQKAAPDSSALQGQRGHPPTREDYRNCPLPHHNCAFSSDTGLSRPGPPAFRMAGPVRGARGNSGANWVQMTGWGTDAETRAGLATVRSRAGTEEIENGTELRGSYSGPTDNAGHQSFPATAARAADPTVSVDVPAASCLPGGRTDRTALIKGERKGEVDAGHGASISQSLESPAHTWSAPAASAPPVVPPDAVSADSTTQQQVSLSHLAPVWVPPGPAPEWAGDAPDELAAATCFYPPAPSACHDPDTEQPFIQLQQPYVQSAVQPTESLPLLQHHPLANAFAHSFSEIPADPPPLVLGAPAQHPMQHLANLTDGTPPTVPGLHPPYRPFDDDQWNEHQSETTRAVMSAPGAAPAHAATNVCEDQTNASAAFPYSASVNGPALRMSVVGPPPGLSGDHSPTPPPGLGSSYFASNYPGPGTIGSAISGIGQGPSGVYPDVVALSGNTDNFYQRDGSGHDVAIAAGPGGGGDSRSGMEVPHAAAAAAAAAVGEQEETNALSQGSPAPEDVNGNLNQQQQPSSEHQHEYRRDGDGVLEGTVSATESISSSAPSSATPVAAAVTSEPAAVASPEARDADDQGGDGEGESVVSSLPSEELKSFLKIADCERLLDLFHEHDMDLQSIALMQDQDFSEWSITKEEMERMRSNLPGDPEDEGSAAADEDDPRSCRMCRSESRQIQYFPCLHLLVCQKCYDEMKAQGHVTCLECQRKVKGFIRTFNLQQE